MSNKVVVQPGGTSFTTIQSAIDSISDASEKLWYQVLCSPGTYEEHVSLKPWVFVIGMDADTDSTIIAADAQGEPKGTVTGASNSGITACTIISNASADFGHPCAVSCNHLENFQLTGCKVYTKDTPSAQKGAICTVALNFYHSGYDDGGPSTSSMTISGCEIHQECTATSSGPSMEAVAADCNSTMEVYNSSISCIGSSDYAGALVSTGGNITVSVSDISCPGMALDIGTGGGSLKAVDCHINGKVGKGVVVVND